MLVQPQASELSCALSSLKFPERIPLVIYDTRIQGAHSRPLESKYLIPVTFASAYSLTMEE